MRLSLLGYIEAIAFAVIFLLFINGEYGWILIYSILAAIIASVVLCVVSRKHFSVSCSGFSGVYSIGDRVTTELKFTRRGFCILPFITVNGRFMGQSFTARCSIIGGSGSVRISLRAKECGLHRLEIDEIILRDFLGLIYFTSGERPENCAAAVLPAIVDYIGPEVLPSPFPSDDYEEAEQSLLSGGIPGYEHRGYVPGDSPHRINYKLSAKKRTLLVRKDESVAAESVEIVLAPGADGGCAEQALALAKRLIANSGSARVIHGKDSFTAGTPAAADRLREWLAFRDFSGQEAAELHRSASLSHTVVTISREGISVA